MADLPTERLLAQNPPFFHTGIDCFGPIMVKRGRHDVKRYGCIFTCFSSRAIHLEMLDSLDTESFINAFRRFVARRSCPSHVWSDNGTNFIGAKNVMFNVNKVHDFSIANGVEWHFQPPLASHMCGVWERLIKTVKRVLAAVIPCARLSDESLRTVLCEVEFIVNSRPLTKVGDDPLDGSVLTPNHLILNFSSPLAPGTFCEADVFKSRWRCVQQIVDQFWAKWLRLYVPELQRRQKWHSAHTNLRIGDVVLIASENTPRGVWPLGLVTETLPSADGLVRKVKLRTKSNKELIRPVTKLVLINDQ